MEVDDGVAVMEASDGAAGRIRSESILTDLKQRAHNTVSEDQMLERKYRLTTTELMLATKPTPNTGFNYLCCHFI